MGDLRTPGGLIIPANVASVKPPKFFCTICKAQFHAEEARAYQRHVVKCVKQNEAEVRELSIRERLPGIYGPEAGDPEYQAHVRKTGRT